jgi:recombination protein RecT
MKSPKSQLEVESYDFEITNPFDRGDVVGGFGYIVYEDPRKNKLVLVTMRDFLKAEAGSGSDKFWGSNKWREEMMHKTMVRRVADKLPLDPKKVNAKSYAYVSEQETDDRIDREIDDNANAETIDISGKVVDGEQESKQPTQEQMDLGSTGTEGPGY